MPKNNKQGPPKSSTGPRNGSGKGKGNHSNQNSGTGPRTGGDRGRCQGDK